MGNEETVKIPWWLYDRLNKLGIIPNELRSYNIGGSDYSQHLIQPWSIWIEYGLNAWDADIVKRVLRTKNGESRMTDYRKIIHDCEERIRQLEHLDIEHNGQWDEKDGKRLEERIGE